MKMRSLKDSKYNELVVLIYRISNDDKMVRLYFYHNTVLRLNQNTFNPVYNDKLLLDLNIYDVYQEHPNNKHLDVNVDPKVQMEFNIKLHDIILTSYYL